MSEWGNMNTTADQSTEVDNKLVQCKYCPCLILPTIAKCPRCGGEQT